MSVCVPISPHGIMRKHGWITKYITSAQEPPDLLGPWVQQVEFSSNKYSYYKDEGKKIFIQENLNTKPCHKET